MVNIFICHRSYHILRSIDLIKKQFCEESCQNILISFDIIDIKSKKYNNPLDVLDLQSFFYNVISLKRDDEVSIWNVKSFLKYYKKKVSEYNQMIEPYSNFDNIFFFSDKEKPVEIIVGLFKEKKKEQSKITIVDEGIAAYTIKRNYFKNILKKGIVKLFNLKYLSSSYYYGGSSLYTNSLATFPEKSVFKGISKHLLPMTSFQDIDLGELKIPNGNYFVYVSNLLPYVHNIKKEVEIDILKKIKTVLLSNDFQLLIKPHPVQEDNYYDCFQGEIINKFFPTELFFSNKAIIGSIYSSSLINSILSGIDTVNLASLFGIERKNEIINWLNIDSPINLLSLDSYLKNKKKD